MPLAEDSGLIVPIGAWVLATTCRQLRDWLDAGLDVPRCSVKLSARQFASDTLVDEVVAALDAHALPSSAIGVEITESALMTDLECARRTLRRLYELGVHIGIDDFGTGYSSLAYLKRFPVQTVKIDRSFIRGLPQDRDDAAITQAIVAMSHSLGIRVVAEGVEQPPQLEFLRELGCDEAQGFHIARPMPAVRLQAWLNDAAAAAAPRAA